MADLLDRCKLAVVSKDGSAPVRVVYASLDRPVSAPRRLSRRQVEVPFMWVVEQVVFPLLETQANG